MLLKFAKSGVDVHDAGVPPSRLPSDETVFPDNRFALSALSSLAVDKLVLDAQLRELSTGVLLVSSRFL